MNGFERLSPEIREEMLSDAKDARRGLAFRAARRKSEQCDLDEYIRFLSDNMASTKLCPTKRLTHDCRL
jgi:hypothetical protein